MIGPTAWPCLHHPSPTSLKSDRAAKSAAAGSKTAPGGSKTLPGASFRAFPGITAKSPPAENSAANIARKPPEPIFTIPEARLAHPGEHREATGTT